MSDTATVPTQGPREGSKSFDPTAHLMDLRGKDYLEVKHRLQWLRAEHPDAVIVTELKKLSNELEMAVFRAEVTLPTGGSATGWGSEEADDFGDYIEKAETKAIGRALGALGYGTQFSPDHDFGGEAGRVVDAPVKRGGSRPTRRSR